MKKYLILLLAFAFLVSMSFMAIGCKEEAMEEEVAEEEEMAEEEMAEEEAEEEMAEEEQITITYWDHLGGQYADFFDYVFDRFEAENPNVTIEYTSYEAASYNELIKAALVAGEAPDIIDAELMDHAYQLAGVGTFLDLTDTITADAEWVDWLELVLPMTSQMYYDGKIFWTPVSKFYLGMLYWKDMWPNGFPETMAELYVESERLIAEGIVPVSQSSVDPDHHWVAIISPFDLQLSQRGKPIQMQAADGEIMWTDDQLVRIYTELQKMHTDGVLPDNILELGYSDGAAPLFISKGAASMSYAGPWTPGMVAEEHGEEIKEELGWTVWPALDGVDKRAATGQLTLTNGVNVDSEHPEIAIELLRMMCDPDSQKFWFRMGQLPMSKYGFEETDDPVVQQMLDLDASGEVFMSRPYIFDYTVANALWDAGIEVLLGTSVEDALSAVQDVADQQ